MIRRQDVLENKYRRQIISIEWATTPPSFNSLFCADVISVIRALKSVIKVKN